MFTRFRYNNRVNYFFTDNLKIIGNPRVIESISPNTTPKIYTKQTDPWKRRKWVVTCTFTFIKLVASCTFTIRNIFYLINKQQNIFTRNDIDKYN